MLHAITAGTTGRKGMSASETGLRGTRRDEIARGEGAAGSATKHPNAKPPPARGKCALPHAQYGEALFSSMACMGSLRHHGRAPPPYAMQALSIADQGRMECTHMHTECMPLPGTAHGGMHGEVCDAWGMRGERGRTAWGGEYMGTGWNAWHPHVFLP